MIFSVMKHFSSVKLRQKPVRYPREVRKELEYILDDAFRDAAQDSLDHSDFEEPQFWEENRSFHNHDGFDKVIKRFWRQIEDVDDHLSLELGSGLGTWSLHAAAAGIESYGVERYNFLIENANNAVSQAYEKDLIEDENLCNYTQADLLEPQNTWSFENGEQVGIEDATIIYACLPQNQVSERIYREIAENMDEDALAILTDGGKKAREKYFTKSELDRDIIDRRINPTATYELDTRPSNYSESESSSDLATTTSDVLSSLSPKR